MQCVIVFPDISLPHEHTTDTSHVREHSVTLDTLPYT